MYDNHNNNKTTITLAMQYKSITINNHQTKNSGETLQIRKKKHSSNNVKFAILRKLNE